MGRHADENTTDDDIRMEAEAEIRDALGLDADSDLPERDAKIVAIAVDTAIQRAVERTFKRAENALVPAIFGRVVR